MVNDMQERQNRYWQLLHQPDRLLLLHQASSVEQFVTLMGDWLAWPELTLDQMLTFIHMQRWEDFTPKLALFSQAWLPYRYCSQSKEIYWIPAFNQLSKPFIEDDISDIRLGLLAIFIQPKTLLKPLLTQFESVPEIHPCLMIFHWSRCGSTLVSSSFSKLNDCLVISESMLCSDIMRDDFWSQELKVKLVDLCLRLQGRFRHGERHLVVKWNAWDLAYWPMLLALYPQSRVLCLIRNPKDILASHQRLAGRHMVEGQGLLSTEWHRQQIETMSTAFSLNEFRISVLQHLAQLTHALLSSNRAILLDYQQIKDFQPTTLSTILGRSLSKDEMECWQDHWRFDAKQQGQVFTPVVSNEPVPLSELQSPSWLQLFMTYNQLLQRLYWDKKHDAR